MSLHEDPRHPNAARHGAVSGIAAIAFSRMRSEPPGRFDQLQLLPGGLDADENLRMAGADLQGEGQSILLWAPLVQTFPSRERVDALLQRMSPLTRFQHRHRLACRWVEPGLVAAPVFVATDWVDALSLEEIIAESGPLDVDGLPDLLRPVAGAIDAAHAANLYFNTLLPERVLFTVPTYLPMFAGLGTGWQRYPELREVMPRVSPNPARDDFAAPEERYLHDEAACVRADIYGFAAICAYALIGMEWHRLCRDPTAVAQRLHNLAGASFSHPIIAGLSPQPAHRPASVSALLHAAEDRTSLPAAGPRPRPTAIHAQRKDGRAPALAPPTVRTPAWSTPAVARASFASTNAARSRPPLPPLPAGVQVTGARPHGAIVHNQTGIEFVYINPAEVAPNGFWMGSDPRETGRSEDESLHAVVLTRGYAISVAPVTWRQWDAAMRGFASPRTVSADRRGHPVTHVSWREANQFCERLTHLERHAPGGAGHPPVAVSSRTLRTTYAGMFALPTEAEWEFACRAGTSSAFAFGDSLSLDDANHASSVADEGMRRGMIKGRTTGAGAYPPNAWGLYDMHGNVWEWCWDFYADYPEVTVDVDPAGSAPYPQAESGYYVARGGSWMNTSTACRSAYRGRFPPDYKDAALGFRVVWYI